ncbi:hypothetical protein LA66_06825 [Aureimonas altamirensis]|uniref:Uncharacterized protein n=1 Tax=Aureimonas altamirensis TaxID=370622 RepID=A0A0B1Q792_9HYPH|nr:hypothetical protein [Aureimonas altamirensis]KHJ56274.1 hypothetical protein LA66_06825 [Aureimonas altamirensis]
MSDNTTSPRFWIVWNPRGRTPTRKHASRAMATNEAYRLAGMNPGEQFFVLKAVAGAACPVPEPVEIKLTAPDPNDDIPF